MRAPPRHTRELTRGIAKQHSLVGHPPANSRSGLNAGRAVTNVYRASRDLFLAQRFARHVSPLTTTVYTHPSDDEMLGRIRDTLC